MIDFRILGPLVVEDGGRELTVAAPRQRIILAALLLNANRVLSVDRLGCYVWENNPPRSGPAVIRTYVMRLRQALGPKAAARIVTRAPGYVIEVDQQETDLGRFNSHRERAGTLVAAGDVAGASAELSNALSIWRQEPLQNVHSRSLRDIEVRHLEERYFHTLTWHLDLDLQLGRHIDLIPELWRLTREHPLREGLAARLMLALFRAGRQFEALNVFHQTRALLIDQLATEPGAELQEIQKQILAADVPQLARSQPSAPVPAYKPQVASQPRPAQLPAMLPDFVPWSPGGGMGGSGDWSSIGSLAEPATTTAITGGGGVGKSTLALHAAHAHRKEFSGGQLYADLGGSRANPVKPADILARFLRDLGVPQASVPQDETELSALYRSAVADKELLIVLDDAHSAAQVRPLIPGSALSRLIVTSGNRLDGLEGARTLVLGNMDEETSLRLLTAIIGRERVDADLPAVKRIIGLSGGLPLAIRIIAIRLLAHRHRPLADMARRLESSTRILDELSVGDLAVRSRFDSSYAALGNQPEYGIRPDAVLRVLGTVDLPAFSAAMVARWLTCAETEAEDALDRLVDANLLDRNGPGSYLFNHLARAYAREQSRTMGHRQVA